MTIMIIVVAGWWSSCREEECDQTMENRARLSFYTVKDGSQVDSTIPNLVIYPETRPDSLLYDSLDRSNVDLPLNPTHHISRFIFMIDSLADTLEIAYAREQVFVSHPCGFATNFQINKANISHQHFDSVKILNNRVDLNEDEEHINLYLSPPDTAAGR